MANPKKVVSLPSANGEQQAAKPPVSRPQRVQMTVDERRENTIFPSQEMPCELFVVRIPKDVQPKTVKENGGWEQYIQCLPRALVGSVVRALIESKTDKNVTNLLIAVGDDGVPHTIPLWVAKTHRIKAASGLGMVCYGEILAHVRQRAEMIRGHRPAQV